MMNYEKNLDIALQAALEAGKSIMCVYDGQLEVEEKSDGSPLTLADRLANNIICKHLETTGIPIISEENKAAGYDQRKNWSYFWLVDPLDGTKEFISRNGEFTVNIALIHNGVSVLGVVTAPALHKAWFAVEGYPPQKIHDTHAIEEVTNQKTFAQDIRNYASTLSTSKSSENIDMVVSVSRSHLDANTKALVKQMSAHYKNVKMNPKGSSLKLCDLADKQSVFYPRFAPTYEWDTAAGHAILKAAGGCIIDLESKQELQYNKPTLLNPFFIAFADKAESVPFISKFAL